MKHYCTLSLHPMYYTKLNHVLLHQIALCVSTKLHSITALNCIECHCTKLHCMCLHPVAQHVSAPKCVTAPICSCVSLHQTALCVTALNWTACLCTKLSLHQLAQCTTTPNYTVFHYTKLQCATAPNCTVCYYCTKLHCMPSHQIVTAPNYYCTKSLCATVPKWTQPLHLN